MRILALLAIALAVLVACAQQGLAQKNDEAERQKRLAEIQKEIKELQAKLESLSAEAARLQAAAKKPPVLTSQGIITRLALQWAEFSLETKSGAETVRLGFNPQIMYSDKQKAKASDLKLGQFVRVRRKMGAADKIVIEKAARRIGVNNFLDQSAAQIAKQVDFATEYLLLFRWEGTAGDNLSFMVEEGKAGPIVDFSFQAGTARNEELHDRLFVIAKNATADWHLERDKSKRLRNPTKITSDKELPEKLENLSAEFARLQVAYGSACARKERACCEER